MLLVLCWDNMIRCWLWGFLVSFFSCRIGRLKLCVGLKWCYSRLVGNCFFSRVG